MYLWSQFGHGLTEEPIAHGVTKDLAEAMRFAEPRLKDGSAFVCVIEEVQTLISVIGLEELHAPTGKIWNGRRNNSGGVHWRLSIGSGDSSLIYRIPESVHDTGAMPHNWTHAT